MIDERLSAVRAVRMEADKLRLACIAAAGGAALLHIAYDREVDAGLTIDDAVILARIDAKGQP